MSKSLAIASLVISMLSLSISVVCIVNERQDVECSLSYETGAPVTSEQL